MLGPCWGVTLADKVTHDDGHSDDPEQREYGWLARSQLLAKRPPPGCPFTKNKEIFSQLSRANAGTP